VDGHLEGGGGRVECKETEGGAGGGTGSYQGQGEGRGVLVSGHLEGGPGPRRRPAAVGVSVCTGQCGLTDQHCFVFLFDSSVIRFNGGGEPGFGSTGRGRMIALAGACSGDGVGGYWNTVLQCMWC
jgi:hypothetical protein